jgi:hypothetical protein
VTTATTPGISSRRRMLAAVATLPLVGAPAAAAAAEDPHPRWAREMRRLLAAMAALPDAPEHKPEWDRLYREMWALRALIAETPAATPAGVIEQVTLAIEAQEGGGVLLETDLRALRTAVASLRRMG